MTRALREAGLDRAVTDATIDEQPVDLSTYEGRLANAENEERKRRQHASRIIFDEYSDPADLLIQWPHIRSINNPEPLHNDQMRKWKDVLRKVDIVNGIINSHRAVFTFKSKINNKILRRIKF